MKAVVFDKFGPPEEVLSIRDVDAPKVGPGEVRVRMLACPVNPSDVLTIRGLYGAKPPLPATPGYEGVGVIEEVGSGWVAWLRRLRPNMRVTVLNTNAGNWAEQVVVSAQHVIPVSDLPDDQAATFFVNPASAVAMVRHVLCVRRGEWLLQTAAGSALCGMVRGLASRDGFRIVNIVRRPEQAQELRDQGHTAFATGHDDIEKEVEKLTNGKGVPYVIDAVGGETALVAANCLADGGRMLVYGVLSEQPVQIDPRTLIVRQATIEGFWLGKWAQQQSIPSMLVLFRRITQLMKDDVIHTDVQEFPMTEIQGAVAESVRQGRTKKVLLRISAD